MSPKTRLSGSMNEERLTAELGLSLDVVTTCLETDVVTTETGWGGAMVITVEAALGTVSCTNANEII